jgi:N-acetylmuramoyl-L-alanine amidase
MILNIRAAGFAAALVTMAVAFHAAPSRAWELSTTPASITQIAAAPAPAIPLPGEATEPAAEPAAAPEPATAAPEAPIHRNLAGLVQDHASARTADAEHECLAGAVYFEAKGEPLRGQLTVAQVILNRIHSGRFPRSACGVVKQRGQFSFVRAGRFPPIARASDAWRKAVAIADIARRDLADGGAPRALFFHARSVSPGWHRLTRIASVGNHVFYR